MPGKILIVDDDPFVCRLCSNRLRKFDFIVSFVHAAEEALNLAHQTSYNVILMDINLDQNDRYNGIECVRRLREQGYKGPICMLTGDDSPDSLLNSALAGANNYLVKSPLLADNLAWEIDRITESSNYPSNPAHLLDPGKDGAYLRSLGLGPNQVDLLVTYHNLGFPSQKELSYKLNLNSNSLTRRISRIKARLGVENLSQIINLMSFLRIMVSRRCASY